ncbi:MAG: esterase family protein [Pyrinomonadaceae bacterium]|nr:esterase family protein [Pyrinomonadaceae bacterium]MCX7639230.1 esterase family protein [Pyrinomonadaceae bacterium]MDW8303548.1 alpha/beta hydrolase family protein [Acidobacteriota bacterium]
MRKYFPFFFLFLLSFVSAQTPQAIFEDFYLQSKLMGRQMPYRIIYPKNYKESKEKRFPTIYLLHGLSGNYKNWSEKTALLKYATEYDFLFVLVEGENGWYSDSPSKPNSFYESYVIEELIPEIDRNFRTIADRNHRIIAGLSMGGYGAIKFGLKYPEKFALVGSFSGALSATSIDERQTLEWISKSLREAFGEQNSQARKANDIFLLIQQMHEKQLSSLPFIYFDCGTEDFLFKSNQDFMKLLTEKKVKHEYRQLPGNHTWDYWNAQIQEFLRLVKRFLEKVN